MTLNDSRPNPDELLNRVRSEETQSKRGRLKIFLGYAAGVGKTFTMLEYAHQRKNEKDVAVAYIETHGRKDTEALLKDLEIIPRRQVEYRGVSLPEMDLDAVLARHPQIAIVDEYAHTNAPGSRHAKRYQDVEELLEAGIDVYTTLNIQHVESLRNIVAQVTDVWMRETVPDSAVDMASEIELVDLPPEELIKRLQEGKVYVFAARITEPDPIEKAKYRGVEPESITVNFTITGLTGNALAEVVDEGRKVSVINGQFTDTFAKNAVHIYKITRP